MSEKYDLTVIGGGPGGYVAAIRASQLGLKVAVVEDREMGGTCLNRGCIPTKALLHSAELYQAVRHCAEFGITVEKASFDYGQIAARKNKVVRQLRLGVESLVKGSGGKILAGRACIRDRHTIDITGKDGGTIETSQIIIATGSRPSRPPIPGIEGDKILDSDSVLELTTCPERVVIIGGGVIGVEFATVFNSLGKAVTIIEMMDSLVPGMDTELAVALRQSLEKKGVQISTSSRVTALQSGENAQCTYQCAGEEKTVEGDIIIVAIGRRPNSENIGLENLHLSTLKGFIPVDERMETAVPGIFAIGDVTGKVLLAHVASAQGLVAAANAAGENRTMQYAAVPFCIYTSPEIAWVGLTEQEARKRGNPIKIGRFPASANGKSLIMGEKDGLVKIITDEATGEILGTHIIGPRATDMIAELGVAMQLESTLEEVAATIHPHPTISEMIMEAAHDVEGRSVHKMNGR